MKITYRLPVWPEQAKPPKPDYWIEVDGKRVGYVHVSRAGRSAGTYARWAAYLTNGTRIATLHSTMRSMKAEVEKYFTTSG